MQQNNRQINAERRMSEMFKEVDVKNLLVTSLTATVGGGMR